MCVLLYTQRSGGNLAKLVEWHGIGLRKVQKRIRATRREKIIGKSSLQFENKVKLYQNFEKC